MVSIEIITKSCIVTGGWDHHGIVVTHAATLRIHIHCPKKNAWTTGSVMWQQNRGCQAMVKRIVAIRDLHRSHGRAGPHCRARLHGGSFVVIVVILLVVVTSSSLWRRRSRWRLQCVTPCAACRSKQQQHRQRMLGAGEDAMAVPLVVVVS